MNVPRLTRRRFLAALLLATPGAVWAEARYLEPTWVKIRHQRIGSGPPVARFVHFTDTHHKGDTAYLRSVVATINSLSPDFVCFTGDIIEEKKYLAEALEIFSGIRAPLYGVPGNHDLWSRIPFAPVQQCFHGTGGAWLMDEHRVIAGGKINLIGITCSYYNQARLPLNPAVKNLLLMHYPAWVKKLDGQQFDLMLAGHSHGGQVRIPFLGAPVVPYNVRPYDLGLYQTPSGPLYVNAGLGYLALEVRFNCRPEITVFEV